MSNYISYNSRIFSVPLLIKFQSFSSAMFHSLNWRVWFSLYTVETPGFLETVSSHFCLLHTPWVSVGLQTVLTRLGSPVQLGGRLSSVNHSQNALKVRKKTSTQATPPSPPPPRKVPASQPPWQRLLSTAVLARRGSCSPKVWTRSPASSQYKVPYLACQTLCFSNTHMC